MITPMYHSLLSTVSRFIKSNAALKTLVLFLAMAFCYSPSTAQLVSTYYTWSSSSQTYTAGTSAVAVPASAFPQSWDDNSNVTAYKFPFDFSYKGTTYLANTAAIGVDTDGWVAFSTTGIIVITPAASTQGNSWVSSTDATGVYLNGNANDNGFCGFNSDLQEQTFATFTGNTTNTSNIITAISDFNNIRVGTRLSGAGITSGTVVNSINVAAATITLSDAATATATAATLTPRTSIYAFTRGIAPFRQFVIQWTRATRFNAPGDDFSFQMVLNEGGGDPNYQTLQAVYGTCKATNLTPQNAQVGLRGAAKTDFNARKTNTSWTNTTAATANTDVCTLTPSVFPPSGYTFTWSPTCLAVPGDPGPIAGATAVCPGTTVDYSIPGVPGAIYYAWTYTGGGTTFSDTTTLPLNSLIFSLAATGGTLTVTARNLCGPSALSSSVAITINGAPTATISYTPSAICKNATPVSAVITGQTGGTFSASPAGLTINAATGQITPATSTVGNYVVTYTFTSGCTATATANVSINALPVVTATATPSNFCSATNSSVLQASVPATGNYTVSSIPYAALAPAGSPTVLWNTYQDDILSAAIPMPWAGFSYYGTPITNFFVSSNGYIQLETSSPVSATAQTLPNAAAPNNIIALAWSDLILDELDFPTANIRYFTNGTTPNRILVVEYTKLRFFLGSGLGQEVTGQIRLYESDNHIEVAALSVNDAGDGWPKTLGVENALGTVGIAAPGRNNGTWNTSNEAWAFFPPAVSLSYLWSPGTFLNNATFAAPTATNVTTTTNYTVTVTNTVTGCVNTAATSITIGAGLSGTYTVGTGGNYANLTAAVAAYNSTCIGGPVIFSLINTYTSAGETFPITINSNVYASATNTLTIKPAVGQSPLISGTSTAALIKLNGADYVTIDGSNVVGGTTQNLTLVNNSTNATTSTVIWLASVNAANGALNNTVKNCIITGNAPTTTWTAVISSGVAVGTIAEAANNNNTYQNNLITKCQTAIALVGATGNETNNIVTGNTIGSSVAGNKLGWSGIEMYQQASAQITNNTVFGITTTTSTTTSGISIFGGANGIVISNNKISDVKNTNAFGFGSNGIYLGSLTTAANVTVRNNFISDIASVGFVGTDAEDNGYGIVIDDGGGYTIDFNSVLLNTSQSVAGTPAALQITSFVLTNAAITLRNNIFANTQTQAGEHYAIQSAAPASRISIINYNDYYVSSGNLGFIGSNRTTLADIQTGFTQNVNSVNVQPNFASATDLHLVPVLNSGLSNSGTTVAGITTDIDADVRGASPDMGADEFTAATLLPLCGTYHIGIAQAVPFNTFTNAIAALNLYGISCAVTFLLDDATYGANEICPVTIKKFTGSSPANTFTVKPNVGTTTTITGAAANAGLLKILSNYVTIDGSNAVNGITRDLTFINTSTTAPSVVHIGSTGVLPVLNSQVKNCNIINGSVNSTAVVLSDGATIGNAGYFNNINIQNNSIQKAFMGIYANATVAAANGSGTTITSNLLNSAGANAISSVGIYLQGLDGATIATNNIGNFEQATTEIDRGIWLATGTVNCTIDKNIIHDINYTGTGSVGPKGIVVTSGSATANITIKNNMIYNISGDGASYLTNGAGLCPVGIYAFVDGQAGVNIYFNTIYLSGATINKANAASIGIALNGNAKATIKNNLILNSLGTNGTGIGSIGIAAQTSNAQFTAISNNNYFCNGAGAGNVNAIGRIAALNYTTPGTWMPASGETFATSFLPTFMSATDLHINPLIAGNLSIHNTGSAVAGITEDIDLATRNGTTPDVGADEWVKPNYGSWVGKTSIDWLVASNWESNYVPTLNDDITVTGGYLNLPTIVTTQAVRNIILSGGSVTTINGGTLQIHGTMAVNTGGVINASNGAVEMKGAAGQIIPALLFQGNNVKDLIISNTNVASGVLLSGAVDVYRSLTFGVGGRRLNTNAAGNLTLKSTATETAWVGPLVAAPSMTIVGDVTVERYIPLHSKAWQFLSIPTNTVQTVKAAWQENQAPGANLGPAGYGTMITNNVAGTGGFDIVLPAGAPSMKTYDTIGPDKWKGITGTDVSIFNKKGYMLFVRGGRGSNGLGSSPSATNLRTKGPLFTITGTPPPVTDVNPNTFESVGNPYASAVDLTVLSAHPQFATFLADIFIIWDPKLTTGPTTAYGFGAYRTLTRNGASYDVTPPGGIYGNTWKTIESGQAFFVRAGNSAGKVTFTESAKTNGSYLHTRPTPVISKTLRTNLNVMKDGERINVDGNMVQFDKSFSNSIDINDAIKLNNTGENLGISANGTLLAVERRKPIKNTDTIFYNLGQVRAQQYEFEFVPTGIHQPNLQAWLEDRFLHSSTDVSLTDTTRIVFAVTNTEGSYSPARFRLVFKQKKKNGGAPVVKAESKVIKSDESNAKIAVYPNPVVERTMQLRFTNKAPGNYTLTLLNSLGQPVFTEKVFVAGNNVNKTIQLTGVTAGSYQLNIMNADADKTVLPVIVQ